MHETNTVSIMLTNCETWVLDKKEREKIERMELWALKKILGVPVTTPTPAIIFTTGTLFSSLRIDQKQLIYLKVLFMILLRKYLELFDFW